MYILLFDVLPAKMIGATKVISLFFSGSHLELFKICFGLFDSAEFVSMNFGRALKKQTLLIAMLVGYASDYETHTST